MANSSYVTSFVLCTLYTIAIFNIWRKYLCSLYSKMWLAHIIENKFTGPCGFVVNLIIQVKYTLVQAAKDEQSHYNS